MTSATTEDPLKSLAVAVARLEERMGALFTLVEQSAKAVQERAAAQSERDADHEARLRALEARAVVTWPSAWKFFAGAAGIAGVGGSLVFGVIELVS